MRKLLIFVVVLLFLVVGLVFALSRFESFLEENQTWLAEQASQILGRSVHFDGIRLSFEGGLGAGLENFWIDDDPRFSKERFISVGEAHVVVKVLPALRGRYEIDRIVLVDPQVHIVRRAEGFNFETLGANAESVPEAEVGGDVSADEPPAPEGAGFAVSIIEIRGGRGVYVNQMVSPPATIMVDQLDFTASNVGFEHPVDIDLRVAALGAEKQNLRLRGSFGPLGSPEAMARAPLDLALELGPLVIDEAKGLALLGEAIPPELLSSDPVSLRADVGGSLAAPVVSASLDFSDAALRYSDVLRKERGTRLSVSGQLRQSPDQVEVSGMKLQMARAELSCSGTIGTSKVGTFDLSFGGDAVPLDGWETLFPAAADFDVGGQLDVDLRAKGSAAAGLPPLHGSVTLREVRAAQPGGGIEISDLSSKVTIDGDRLTIPPTEFRIAGNPAKIEAKVSSLRTLAADGELAAERIRLAPLGFGGEGLAKEEALSQVVLTANFESAADGPRLRGSLRSSGGVVRDVDYQDLVAEVALANERATLRKLSVGLFDGSIQGAATYHLAEPRLSFRGRVRSLDVASIVAYLDLASVFDMTGKVVGDLDVSGSGQGEALKQSLEGDGGLRVEDGVLRNFNVAGAVLGGVTGVPGLTNLLGGGIRKRYPEIFGSSDTVFERIVVDVDIGEGRSSFSELTIAARDYKVEGKGYIAFDGTVDIRADFVASEKLTKDLQGSVKEIGHLLNPLRRLSIPIKITGTLPDVKTRPDLEHVATRLSTGLIGDGINKGLGSLLGSKKNKKAAEPKDDLTGDQPLPAEDAAGELIQRGLNGLFGD